MDSQMKSFDSHFCQLCFHIQISGLGNMVKLVIYVQTEWLTVVGTIAKTRKVRLTAKIYGTQLLRSTSAAVYPQQSASIIVN